MQPDIKNTKTALFLENINADAIRLFKKAGYKVHALPHALGESELAKALADCSILGIRSKTQVTKKAIQGAPNLLAIGAFCIGTNQIDLEAATERGIALFNAPFSNTRSVVELAMAEIIMLLRKTVGKSSAAHNGLWDKSSSGCFEVRGKRLGIVGYGHIGSQLSVIAENLGMHVLYFDTEDKLALGNARRSKSLAQLLKESDVVTLHVDGRPANRNLMSKKEFALMKKGSYFLNLSRGHVVDIESLAIALKSGKIAGAAIDVYPEEPVGSGEKFVSVLQNIPNVILTPHVGGSTEEAQSDIAHYVSSHLLSYVDTGTTAMSVNLPAIRMPSLKSTRRIIHIHKNVPGILARINDVFASRHINILGQQLHTNDHVGYVMTDVAKYKDTGIVEALTAIPDTILTRVVH